MKSFINVTSEIGKLNTVILHRPGREIENLSPALLERLLFDDIPYLEVAKKEHDIFAKILRCTVYEGNYKPTTTLLSDYNSLIYRFGRPFFGWGRDVYGWALILCDFK